MHRQPALVGGARQPARTPFHGVIAGALALFLSSASDPLGDPGGPSVEPRLRCEGCHVFPVEITHPVGVPGLPVEGLPLAEGRIDCLTCHRDPSDDPDHRRSGAGAELRRPLNTLCLACHPAAVQQTGAVGHAMYVGRAHLTAVEPKGAAVGLDHESRLCLGCHDGSIAPSAKVTELTGASAWGAGSDISSAHPVGVDYDPFRRMGALRPDLSLSPGVRLFDDRVGCGSCHSPYAGQEHLLSVEMRGDRLCLSCHVK